MYMRLGVLLTVLIVAVVTVVPVRAGVQDFVIDSFEANYLITRDENGVSQAYVREVITATFPDSDQNHGILRALPETYDGHSLELAIDKVVDEQQNAYKYETYSENDNKVLKIGDPDSFVQGTKKYFIDYQMRGVISKQAEHDEFFWNINGTQWQQPFGKVSVLVRVEDESLAAALLPKTNCYAGPQGSLGHDCKATNNEKGVVFETTRPLAPGENLSVAVAFNKDTFSAYQPSAQVVWGWVLTGIGIALPPLITLWIVVRNWRRFGRDPEGRGTIVPEYLPPKNESVLASSVVLVERFDVKSVTATIIDLAVRHYLKIFEVKDKPEAKKPSDYELELIKSDGLKPEEHKVVELLFGQAGAGTRIKLSSKSTKLATQVQKLGRELDDQVTGQGYFSRSPSKARLPYIIWGIVLLAVSFVAWPFTIGLTIAGVVLLVASPAMPARTQKGVELRDYLLGIRDYIKLAEADRLKVLQSPHGELTEKVNIDNKRQLVKLYEKLLPYAILFGLEKDWAKEMAALYEDESPSWYGSQGGFRAAYLASAISGFGTASAATFAPPSSSSGSGFSGGGSGGGGGGGGGDGW